MGVGVEAVDAPQQDHAGVGYFLWVGAEAVAVGGLPGRAARGGADGGLELAGPQGPEESQGVLVLHQAHGAGVVVGQHRLGAVLRQDLPEPLGNLVQRHLPAHPLKPALALWAHPPHGVKGPLGVVLALGVAVGLDAGEALGDGVGGVAPHLQEPVFPLINGEQQAAGVGAVQRTGGAGLAEQHTAIIGPGLRPPALRESAGLGWRTPPGRPRAGFLGCRAGG